MSVLTSSVSIRKDSPMIVRSAPQVMPSFPSAHPTVYGAELHRAQTSSGLLNWPDQTPYHLSRTPEPPLALTTDHAGLVLLGKFAQHLGLIEHLQRVPLAQRTRIHSPQAKLIQFFVGIL